ncbi:MAG: redoxin domain-containing protein [Thermodesulfobacteriota bacterium]
MKHLNNISILLFVIIGFSINSFAEDKNFSLDDQNGNNITLTDYGDKIVVLEWTNPDCPFVQRHYREQTMLELAEKYKDKEVVWLAVNSTHYMDNSDNKKWADKNNISYPILNDSSGTVGKMYGAKTTPHMYIINKSEGLVYEGGIDDDPNGSSDQRTEYVDLALTNLSSGNAVEISKSKPYGCSVKYKN